MGDRSSVDRFEYSVPDPFVLPVIQEKQKLISGILSDLIPRETLYYSADVLEEIMLKLNQEFQKRGSTKPTWKKYKSSTTDYTEFNPKATGANLRSSLVKWFAQYIADIQSEIDRLISDIRIPDSRAAYLARVFCNNTTVGRARFTDLTKLYNSMRTGIGLLDPLSRAQAGLWPFEVSYLRNPGAIKGVGFGKEQLIRINQGAGSIEAPTPDFPQSEIGLTTPSGIGGLDISMRNDNRPIIGNRIMSQNTSQGVGQGHNDVDQGFTFVGHVPHVIQAIRYQPPMVEWWPENILPKDYVSNVYSNTTPNKPWYFGQQIETEYQQNWGFWLMKGYVGVVNNRALLRIYNNPMSESAAAGICPYSLWYPPPTGHCTCQATENSYFIWYTPGFRWSERTWIQGGNVKPRYFGPNTKLKVKISSSLSGGQNVTYTRFTVSVRVQKIADINLQPFVSVIEVDLPHTGILEVLLQEKLNQIYGDQCKIGGLDGISALSLVLESNVHKEWDVAAESYKITYPNGGFNSGLRLPANAPNIHTCRIPNAEVYIDYVALDEEVIVGDPVSDYA